VRRNIRHQPDGLRFPAEGSVEWPLDAFTKRRLRDGDVMLESAEDTKARDEQRRQFKRSERTSSSSSSSSS
jgi:hypothetical protein